MLNFIPAPELLLSPVGRAVDGACVNDLEFRRTRLPGTRDILIVGAGLAAMTAATHLWHAGRRDIVIVDPHDRLAARFLRRVDAIQQSVLRSPYEHHPGADGLADCEMVDFARFNWRRLTARERAEVRMAQAGQRSVVPLDVFRGFCSRVARIHDLAAAAVQAEVTQLCSVGDGFLVTTTAGQTKASHVIAAVSEEAVRAPDGWDVPDGGPVRYWDQPGALQDSEHVAVVGSGLTAAHLIRHHLGHGRCVSWVQRGRERFQCSDVEASYFRPEGRARFLAMDREGRQALIRRQRTPSVMFEFAPGLREAEADGRLTAYRDTGRLHVDVTSDGSARIRGEGSPPVTASLAVLALGTRPAALPRLQLPSGERVEVGDLRIDDRSLRAAPMGSLYVSGVLATGALGPAARNIDGHRVAAQMICADLEATA